MNKTKWVWVGLSLAVALVIGAGGYAAFHHASAPASVSENAQNAAAQGCTQGTAYKTFKVSSDPAYGDPRAVLANFAAQKATTKTNTFSVVGYTLCDGSTEAWVYWKEGNALILWEPAADGIADLTKSRRYIRIPQDVVASQDQVNGSSYLVTQQWVSSTIAQCTTSGETFVISTP